MMAINSEMVNCLHKFLSWQFSFAGIVLGNYHPPPPQPPAVISNGPLLTGGVHFTPGLQSEVQSLR